MTHCALSLTPAVIHALPDAAARLVLSKLRKAVGDSGTSFGSSSSRSSRLGGNAMVRDAVEAAALPWPAMLDRLLEARLTAPLASLLSLRVASSGGSSDGDGDDDDEEGDGGSGQRYGSV